MDISEQSRTEKTQNRNWPKLDRTLFFSINFSPVCLLILVVTCRLRVWVRTTSNRPDPLTNIGRTASLEGNASTLSENLILHHGNVDRPYAGRRLCVVSITN